MRAALLLLAFAALAGCSTIRRSTSMFPNRSHDWRQVATKDDEGRLRDWRSDFISALTAARRAGHGSEIDREGVLLTPEAALAGPSLPDGLYHCRRLRVGAKGPGSPDFSISDALTCRVSQNGSLQSFVLLGGVQREVGLIFPADAIRGVFLGTLMLPGESLAMQYGADDDRDVAGYVERIGPRRWRVVMPGPHFDSQLEVLDLVPMTAR